MDLSLKVALKVQHLGIFPYIDISLISLTLAEFKYKALILYSQL